MPNTISPNKLRLIEEVAAMDLGIEVDAEDLKDIDSEEILLCMLESYFLEALGAGYFALNDMNEIFVSFCTFYTNSEAEYRQPSTNIAEYSLSTAQWAKANAEREMAVFISVFMKKSYLDKEYAMDFVCGCVQDWGPKAIQILRPACVEAHDRKLITDEDFAVLSLPALTIAIDKAQQILRPEFVEAYQENRITDADIMEMSVAELTTAIDENRYPQDSASRPGSR